MTYSEIDYVNLYSKDSVVGDGKIIVPSHLKISGLVRMNIESEGKVVITETGVVDGNVRAAEVQIYGKVSGDIRSHGIFLHKNSDVRGAVFAEKLSVEAGAICNFDITVGESALADYGSLKSAPVSRKPGLTENSGGRSNAEGRSKPELRRKSGDNGILTPKTSLLEKMKQFKANPVPKKNDHFAKNGTDTLNGHGSGNIHKSNSTNGTSVNTEDRNVNESVKKTTVRHDPSTKSRNSDTEVKNPEVSISNIPDTSDNGDKSTNPGKSGSGGESAYTDISGNGVKSADHGKSSKGDSDSSKEKDWIERFW